LSSSISSSFSSCSAASTSSVHCGHLVLLLFVLGGFGLLLFFHLDHPGIGVHGELVSVAQFVGSRLKGGRFAVLAHNADGGPSGKRFGFGSNDPAVI
jgi:hypothetical protein